MSDLVPPSTVPAMAAVAAPPAAPVGPDTLITIKIVQNGSINRRLKLPLRELGARVFPQTIREFLSVPPTETLVLERYSDSLANYILLDSENPAVYKQLYRAAKAKLKLRIKATTTATSAAQEMPQPPQESSQTHRYLDPVLDTVPSPSVPAPAVSSDDLAPVPTTKPEFESSSSPAMTSRLFREEKQRAYPLRLASIDHPGSMFCIDCNNCGGSIPGEHYHCGSCDNGDYDLCPACVDAGVSCSGDDHWLLKRFVQNGIIINSTTETVAPKHMRSQQTAAQPIENVAVAKTEEPTMATEKVINSAQDVTEEPEPEPAANERTCNACFREFQESTMVSCNDCDDYDLCVTCLLKDKHGHNPAHEFSVLDDDQYSIKNLVLSRCRPGRHFHHAAICDGCEKRIVGVRHKCTACPDWDYCWSCVKTADQSHPHHRFVPIYGSISEPARDQEVHYGIYCDGPLCRSKPSVTYITGVRYKCSICHDTDFCAACEALPTSTHNRTHPLIKFRTPVRSVSIHTMGNLGFGGETVVMGDHSAPAVSSFAPSFSTETPTVVESPSVVEKVEVEETPEKADEETAKKPEVVPQVEEAPVIEAIAEPVETVSEPTTETASKSPSVSEDYSAYFMRDTIPDGTNMAPSHVFEQTWTLYNPGPSTWPAGTSVRFVGGDAMFNVNTEHPSSIVALAKAMSSNELTHPVAPSESANFSVTLKSSQHPGTSISYWRLKLPNGTPFGHKLWCDIKVVDEPATAEVESETPLAGSNMVFPKLEKESPVASTHQALSEPYAPSVAAPVSSIDDQATLGDLESLTLEDSSEDDGFFTDEEYDILDASDQESFNGKQA